MKKVCLIIIAAILIVCTLSGCKNSYKPPVFDKDDQWATPSESQDEPDGSQDESDWAPDDDWDDDESQETTAPEPVVPTWKCSYCGANSTGNFCSSCGRPKPTEKWTCTYCSQANKPDTNICIGCGRERVEQVDHKSNKTIEEVARSSKITMVNIWTTWCPPCIHEIPEIEKINQKYKDQGVTIIGACADTSPYWTTINSTLSKGGATYLTVLYDKELEKKFPLVGNAVPTTYFLDSNGQIVGDPIGGAYTSQYAERIESMLKDLD